MPATGVISLMAGSRFWRLCGGLTVTLLIIASLLLPPSVEEMRTGYWAVEHFIAYFAAMFIVFLGWRRPFAVAGTLIVLGVLLEALQCLQPGHVPNIFAALSSVTGVLAAFPFVVLLIPRSPEPRTILDRTGGDQH